MSFCSTSVSSPAVMGMAAWEQSTHPRPDTMNKGAQRVAELRRLEQITIAKTCNRLQHIYIYIIYCNTLLQIERLATHGSLFGFTSFQIISSLVSCSAFSLFAYGLRSPPTASIRSGPTGNRSTLGPQITQVSSVTVSLRQPLQKRAWCPVFSGTFWHKAICAKSHADGQFVELVFSLAFAHSTHPNSLDLNGKERSSTKCHLKAYLHQPHSTRELVCLDLQLGCKILQVLYFNRGSGVWVAMPRWYPAWRSATTLKPQCGTHGNGETYDEKIWLPTRE